MLSKKKLDALLERSRWLANGELPSHVVFARLVEAEIWNAALRNDGGALQTYTGLRKRFELNRKQAAQAAKEGR